MPGRFGVTRRRIGIGGCLLLALLPLSAARAEARLSGTVRDAEGGPLAGALVVLRSLDYELPPYHILTKRDGAFEFRNLPTGAWRLTVSLPGFATEERRIAVGRTPPPPVEIRLEELAPPGEPAPEDEAAPEPPAPAPPPPEGPRTPLPRPEERPLGWAGAPIRPLRFRPDAQDDFLPIVDRWRIGFPSWDRHPGRRGEYPFSPGRWWDPYRQNVLKGDYPIWGNRTFFILSLIQDSLAERRKLPVPSGPSASRPFQQEFFGNGNQLTLNSNTIVSFDLFRGDTAFRPADWRLRFTPVANVSYLRAHENGVVNVDVRRGTSRRDGHIGIQEGFAEVKLLDVNPRYDFVSLRVGVQGFVSDFRGFIFAENQLGARLFGNWGSNRNQWNLAAFRMLEKDTNSGLNTTRSRHQEVYVANWYRQDFVWPGYTIQASVHLNVDHAGRDDPDGGLHFDNNGFLVRPAPIGDFTQFVPERNNLRVRYLGIAGDGHIGLLNVSHVFYLARGSESHNPIAGRPTDVEAKLGALELSVDRDWRRYRASVLWQEGDEAPLDGRATGFASIFDNNNFAGGGFAFWNRQGIRLTGTGVGLTNRFSLLNDLRSSREEGQANFVNPGLLLFNVGADVEATPKLKFILNASYLKFDRTEIFEQILFQPDIRRDIGLDASAGMFYRPLLTDNVIVNGGFAVFYPASGFRDLFTRQTLYSGFLAVTLTY